LESLWAILKGYRKATGKCPNPRYQPKGEEAELPSGFRQKYDNFCSFPLTFLFIFLKIKNSNTG
jgi:hypothetical protein